MPYYKTIKQGPFVEASFGNSGAPPFFVGKLAQAFFIERVGWRTKAPIDAEVTPIPDRVAEPYSWLDEYQSVKERTVAPSHEWAKVFKRDKGHPWDMTKVTFKGDLFTASTQYTKWSNQPLELRSNVRPNLPTGSALRNRLSRIGTGSVELGNYAALMYGRTAPTSDEFSVSAFLGELREGLPRLIPSLLKTGSRSDLKSLLKKQTRRAKDAGDDYLNVQFGWLPLLNDLRSIASALALASEAISGPSLSSHRRRDGVVLDETKTVTSSSVNFILQEDFSLLGGPGGSISQTSGAISGSGYAIQRAEVHHAFEAQWVKLPAAGAPKPGSYLDKLDELMRWDLTPGDLWQLTPWSWLVDWFFDIGGQIESWQAATSNRILSAYAYGMREERLTTSFFLSNLRAKSSDYSYVGPRSAFQQTEVVTKMRVRANPFGFVLDPTVNLNGGQLAILGALGLTKFRR